MYYYDKNDGDAWDSSNDWIGLDNDNDGVYTDDPDMPVDCDGSTTTDVGTCDPHNPGDPLTATASSDNLCADDLVNPNFVYIDGTGGDDCNTDNDENGVVDDNITALLGTVLIGTYSPVGSNWAYVDADSDGVYDNGEDLYIENVAGELTYSETEDITIAGTAPLKGVPITDTKDSDWTTLYFYDATTDGGSWDSNNDIIFVDDGNVYYDNTKDTKLAGATTENAQGTLTEPTG